MSADRIAEELADWLARHHVDLTEPAFREYLDAFGSLRRGQLAQEIRDEGLEVAPPEPGHASTTEDDGQHSDFIAELVRRGREHDQFVHDGPARVLMCGCVADGSRVCATHERSA